MPPPRCRFASRAAAILSAALRRDVLQGTFMLYYQTLASPRATAPQRHCHTDSRHADILRDYHAAMPLFTWRLCLPAVSASCTPFHMRYSHATTFTRLQILPRASAILRRLFAMRRLFMFHTPDMPLHAAVVFTMRRATPMDIRFHMPYLASFTPA